MKLWKLNLSFIRIPCIRNQVFSSISKVKISPISWLIQATSVAKFKFQDLLIKPNMHGEKQSLEHVLQNRYSWKFCKFHGKAPVLESLFNKVADLLAYNFIKKRLQHRCFPVNVAQFLRTPVFYRPTPVAASAWWRSERIILTFPVKFSEITQKKARFRHSIFIWVLVDTHWERPYQICSGIWSLEGMHNKRGRVRP